MAGNLFDKQINLPYIIGAIILLGTIGLVKKDKKSQSSEVVKDERIMA
jgi:DHA1 family multidrug resistance protein-like MFS transporter